MQILFWVCGADAPCLRVPSGANEMDPILPVKYIKDEEKQGYVKIMTRLLFPKLQVQPIC